MACIASLPTSKPGSRPTPPPPRPPHSLPDPSVDARRTQALIDHSAVAIGEAQSHRQTAPSGGEPGFELVLVSLFRCAFEMHRFDRADWHLHRLDSELRESVGANAPGSSHRNLERP